jgi:hypothetical protein
MKAIQTITRCLLLAGCLAATAEGQIPASSDEPISPDQLALRYYTPRVLDNDELLNVAQELFGPRILIGSPDGDSFGAAHFLLLQGSIIVRDSTQRAEAILVELAEIENALYPPEEDSDPAPRSKLESFEYAPRFLTIDAAQDALEGFRRTVRVPTPDGGWVEVDNMSKFEERHMLLVRETPERLADIRRLLETVDVPVPQASFTFLLIRAQAAGAAASKELPAELVEHLGRLLPTQSFELVASGLMRGSVRGELSVQTGQAPHSQYTIQLEPAAFDPTTRELTLERCGFLGEEATPDGEWQTHHRIEAALSLRAGEYTVIGAVGSDPLFVVLRMEL